jgi:hypothetical protein
LRQVLSKSDEGVRATRVGRRAPRHRAPPLVSPNARSASLVNLCGVMRHFFIALLSQRLINCPAVTRSILRGMLHDGIGRMQPAGPTAATGVAEFVPKDTTPSIARWDRREDRGNCPPARVVLPAHQYPDCARELWPRALSASAVRYAQ